MKSLPTAVPRDAVRIDALSHETFRHDFDEPARLQQLSDFLNKKSVRILHVVPSFGLGGMERVVCALINDTSDSCVHEILTFDHARLAARWIKDKNIKFIDFEKSANRGNFFRVLYGSLKKARPDLLMTYNWGATDAVWLGRLAGIKHIIHNEHGFNVEEAKKTNWKRDAVRFLIYRLAARLIVVSRELEKLLARRYLLPAGHVRRIPNGIDCARYSPDCHERQQMRQVLGFAPEDVVLGFSGRLDPVKNLGLLIDVFASCLREHSQLRLLIVGDGSQKKHVEALCERQSLTERVVFTGEQEEVLPYLRAMDLFLLTSLREQMPMTVLESMAVGIPVVATNVGDIPYIIDDGIDGFVLDVNASAKEFVEIVSSLIDPAFREAIGAAARKKVVNMFPEKGMVEQYKGVMQELP